MGRMVKGFTHRTGVHCESSAIRDVLAYQGFLLSEEIVFGLDSTFGFVYQPNFSGFPLFHIAGKVRIFPNTLPRLLGVKVNEKRTSDRLEAWLGVKRLVDRDIPVLLRVDIYYLDYLGVPREPWNHFGAHMVVLAGYDEEKGVAYLADTNLEGLQLIPLKSLETARASTFGPFPASNTWFELEIGDKPKISGDKLREAIRTTAREMTTPKRENFGLKGLEMLAEDIERWPKVLPREKLGKTLFIAYVDMEKAGTGGGNFRKLYSRFLVEPGEKVGDKKMLEAGKKLGASAELWTETANLFLKASRSTEIENILFTTKENILSILELEERVFRLLATV
ncbi:MAG: hypothetical protein DRO11_05765 [Methanobacteriota archaeon]|nr:MAG: hypothetical protein DRO11_05765 [Euryarchaeota archaeon]